MSEVNTDNSIETEGIPEISLQLEVQQTVQAPVDPTLTVSGMAADARETGLRIAAAKQELQTEIAGVSESVAAVAGLLFPVGCIYATTSNTAPTFGGTNWNWEEILMPATWGDIADGSRSYKTKEEEDTPGTLHFWRRIDDTVGGAE
jgi:hypothetical protein